MGLSPSRDRTSDEALKEEKGSYASGNNGVRYTILVSTEVTSTGEEQEVLRPPDGMTVIRLEKGKYQLLSEFLGDQVLTTFDPNRFDN